VEIAAVEIHAEPGAVDRLDDLQHAVRLGDDAAVVLQTQADAPLTGVVAAFLNRGDAHAPRLGVAGSGRAAGKDADVRRAHDRGVVDPALHIGDLLVELRSLRTGKVVADRGAADLDAAPGRVLADFGEVFRAGVRREEVAGQLRAGEALVRAEIDELEHVHLAVLHLLLLAAHVFEVIAEAVGREAEIEARTARPRQRIHGKRGRNAGAQGGGGGGLQKTATGKGEGCFGHASE
jgi:hypothetical protein